MRPINRPQSAIRAPLNAILGTEASIRLLRVLVDTDAPVGQTLAAKLAGLNPSGAGRSLAALEELGIVEYVGAGPRKLVALRGAHPLCGQLRALFAAERARFASLVDRMREGARLLPGPPAAVWIEGPVATDTDTIADPVGLGVLAGSKDLPGVLDALAGPVDLWSEELDVTVEVRGLTLPDLQALTEREMDRLAMVIPLLGPPPLLLARQWNVVPAKKKRTHADLDADALRRAADVAEAIALDSGLVRQALANVRARLTNAAEGEHRDLREWQRVLSSMSTPRLRRFLVDPGERATRLRQSMPFHPAMPPRPRRTARKQPRARKNRE